MKKISHLLGAFLALAFSFHSHSALLETLPAAKGSSQEVSKLELEHSKRHRLVKYDASFMFLAEKDFHGQRHIASNLQLNLFDSSLINAKVEHQFTRKDGKTVWQGKVVGEPLSSVNIIANHDQLTGNIISQGRVYQLRTQSDGHILVNEFAAPQNTTTDLLSPLAIANAPQAKILSSQTQQNSALPRYSDINNGFTDNGDVNVLVYYTRQALEDIPDLLNVIDLEFIDTNNAFSNSGIDASVSIAAKIEVDESTIEYGEDVYEFINKSGPFRNIDTIRAKYQADLVHLYVSSLKGACGRAYYAAFPDGGTAKEYSYGTTSAWCTGNQTTAHELGHNFGAAHDRYVEDGGSADYSNYGYVDLQNQFKTIMSYDDKCSDNDTYCSTIIHFSNPQISYNEHPTGIAEPLAESSNNAAQINYSAYTVANFYGVSAPVITSITQGDLTDKIELNWTAIDKASAYRVHRRATEIEANNSPLCSYPVYGDEFEVTENTFVDTSVTSGTTYCYSVTALNDQLLDNISSPESFVRTGYASSDSSLMLPMIENIVIQDGQQSFELDLDLPATNEYQIAIAEYSGSSAPVVSLSPVSSSEYIIQLTDIPTENQAVTLVLTATKKDTLEEVNQLFNLYITGIENQQPSITMASSIELNQQSSAEVAFSISDDQDLNIEGAYAYSKNEALIKQVNISQNAQGDLFLEMTHEGLKTGMVELVVGYTDGEYTVEKTIAVNIKRTIFNPTQVQNNVVWYVDPGQSITRLLPFYDIDDGEALSITMVDQPQYGTLEWPLFDKVTYSANSDFTSDSFSFYVTGEDNIDSEVVTVIIKPSSEAPPSFITQKLISDSARTVFLSHTGQLYVWGHAGFSLGIEFNVDGDMNIYDPKLLDENTWLDVAFSGDIITIKRDGTLWFAGYDPETDAYTSEFKQIGTDHDWRSVNSVANPNQLNLPVLLIKSDGSIWGKGGNFENYVTNREEYVFDQKQPIQIQPIYNVRDVKVDGAAAYAVTKDDRLYSWGSNYFGNLGRESDTGYLNEIEVSGHLSQLQVKTFRSSILVDNRVYGWGNHLSTIFDMGSDSKIYEPTLLQSEQWKSITMGGGQFAGIKIDNTLWTMGSQYSKALLGRGMDPILSLTQVGEMTNWQEVWSSDYATFAMDANGQLWVTGGVDEEYSYPAFLGLGKDVNKVYSFTRLQGFPADIAGVEDNDHDGILDYLDPDDDNDDVLDLYDDLPYDSSESLDTDGDDVGNNADNDDDNDGILDSEDVFPLNASESADTDEDGVGNNTDTDDDNDGVLDDADAFPLDASESVDTDGDSIGNNADPDDDNDGVEDAQDAFPLDASKSVKPTPPSPTNTNSGGSGGGSFGYLLLVILLFNLGHRLKHRL
jgi:hypothetical protein